jgi:predicted nucleotidyltransferase
MEQAVIDRIRSILADLYGERLAGLVLHGSRARGDFDEDSDIDLLVLLEGPVDFGAELRAIVDALYEVQLDLPVAIEALPASRESFREEIWPLYRTASAEGVRL